MFLRQAARRCAQGRRTTSVARVVRTGLHTSAGPSRTQVTRRDVFLGTAAAVVGFGIWRYSTRMDSVYLDAEVPPKKVKKNRARDTEPSSSENDTPKLSDTQTPVPSPKNDKSEPEQLSSSDVGTASPDTDGSEPASADGGEGQSTGGAFNPVTGEINWDCPCLGGMAYGPCGEQFREAFSCFVYSEDEPKGINCVDKFRAMQDCFRAHPEVYGEEIMRDDDEEEEGPDAFGDKTQVEGEVVQSVAS